MSEENNTLFQRVRNIIYMVSAVLGIWGLAVDEAFIGAITAGVIAIIGIVTDLIAWWYSRKKYEIKVASEPPVAS